MTVVTIPSLVLCAAMSAPAGESRALDTCVPADAVAVYLGRPSPEMMHAPAGGAVDKLASMLVMLKATGVIPEEGRVIADVLGTLPMLCRMPHALVLLDISSKRVARDTYRLEQMQLAFLIDSGEGLTRTFDRRIRDLLRTYGDADEGQIERLTHGEMTYHRLTDRRTPDWLVIEWGEIGPYVLVTLGRGAFEKMRDTLEGRTALLGDDPWFAEAHENLHGATSGVELFADFVRLRRRLSPGVRSRADETLRALGLGEARRLLWATGFDGRALRSELQVQTREGRDDLLRLSGKEIPAPEVAGAIPPQASRYAAFRFPLADGFRAAHQSYMASQSVRRQRRFQSGWAKLQETFAFDVDMGLINRLGDHLVIHTYPLHPLGVSGLFTIWIQHEGDRASTARTVDAMMRAWQATLNAPTDTQPAVGLRPQVRRADDGIWYLQLGLVGPAVGVTDGWVIISFSPQAVRDNLAHLAGVPAKQGADLKGKP